jgi:hypothetical protein
LKKLDTKQLSRIISRELGKLFDNIEIVDVIVSPDHDRDGDTILRVEVIFTGDLRDTDAKKVAGATRQIRPALDEIDEDLYPLLSLVSKVDYERGHKRAAH